MTNLLRNITEVEKSLTLTQAYWLNCHTTQTGYSFPDGFRYPGIVYFKFVCLSNFHTRISRLLFCVMEENCRFGFLTIKNTMRYDYESPINFLHFFIFNVYNEIKFDKTISACCPHKQKPWKLLNNLFMLRFQLYVEWWDDW